MRGARWRGRFQRRRLRRNSATSPGRRAARLFPIAHTAEIALRHTALGLVHSSFGLLSFSLSIMAQRCRYLGTLVHMVEVERIQTGVRMEKRLLKVLKG